ncbi:MAG: ribonuclease D [Rhodospirillales bacterium]
MTKNKPAAPGKVHAHKGDLPAGVSFGDAVAVDTETQGLHPNRDRLCVVQLSAGDGEAHLVQLPGGDYDAPNLKALLADPGVVKIFHYARFDVAMIRRYLGVDCAPVYCTKIASRLVRTYTESHGLSDLSREFLGVDMDKRQQSSDWAQEILTPDQIRYAAADVLYLHELRAALDERLVRENRAELAQACFDFIAVRAALDLAGWRETDIFAH